MIGIGWSELLIIAVVVLIVVGPKDLPMMLRNMGKAMGAVRRMSNEFRREMDKAIALDEVKEAQKAISDPLKQTSDEISREFNKMRNGKVEPSGKIKPSRPGNESITEELRERAGLPPAGKPQARTAAEASVNSPVVAGASGAATPSKADGASSTAKTTNAKPKGRAPARTKATSTSATAKPAATKSAAAKSTAAKAKTVASKTKSSATAAKSKTGAKTGAKSSRSTGTGKTASAGTAKTAASRATAPEKSEG